MPILCRTVCAEDRERIARAYNDGGDNVAVARQLSIQSNDGLVNFGPAHSFVYLFGLTLHMPVPVAQLVERWTPCGESTRPGYESTRVRGATGAWYL